jgi:hypothetical protein
MWIEVLKRFPPNKENKTVQAISLLYVIPKAIFVKEKKSMMLLSWAVKHDCCPGDAANQAKQLDRAEQQLLLKRVQ